jgi:16S rRNA (guanine527-N7)-methyltransferase
MLTIDWKDRLDWQPSTLQQHQFDCLYETIVAGNRRSNLTRITTPEDFWEKHLWDSLRGVGNWLMDDKACRTIDIGTGGGFPAIPLAIARSDWFFSAIDSTTKKIDFVRAAATTLELDNLAAIVARSEELARTKAHRECYDLAVIRAVASASVCVEYAVPFLAVGGTAILYRGNWTELEAESTIVAAEILGAEIVKVDAFTTPLSQAVRHCIHLQKKQSTPDEYPRQTGIPTRLPLGLPIDS